MSQSLIGAILDEDVQAVEALLKAGADPNASEDADRITPLHFVAQNTSIKGLQIAQLLLQFGANHKAKSSPDGYTPLDIAQLMSNHQMVSLLSNTPPKFLH